MGYMREMGIPLTCNNKVELLMTGRDKFTDLFETIRHARHHIHLEYFNFRNDSIANALFDLLAEKVKEGVEARAMFDAFGNWSNNQPLKKRHLQAIKARGIEIVKFDPITFPYINHAMHRDHRKIVVVDGKTAFTGGFNLADEYINQKERFGYWCDTGVRLQGPAAWSFATIFLELWASQRPDDPGLDAYREEQPFPAEEPTVGLVQPYSDSPVDDENVSKNVYLDLITQAQETLWITTPYLILDNATMTALRLAAKRGVDVRIYTPGIPDKKMVYQLTRSYFEPLIRSGVKIYTFTPGFLHAKTWLVDGRIAVVGSINLDYRSLYLHFECAALLYGCAALADVGEFMMQLEKQSHLVELKECRTSAPGLMVSALLRLLAPLC